jgi:protein-S-isoprenylcysteine O-methyltransferase Ste14
MISPRVFDRGEQLVALIFYSFLVARIWPERFDAANLAPALLLVTEGTILVFLLLRRSTADISLRPRDWIVAMLGTTAPLLVMKIEQPHYLAVGALLVLFGMTTQLGAKLSLRRSFGLVAANRGVKTGGFYRFVRHPMYLGYMITHVGFLTMSPSLWNFSVYAVAWVCLIMRVVFEEQLLSEDGAYQEFKKRVRFRLIPGIY